MKSLALFCAAAVLIVTSYMAAASLPQGSPGAWACPDGNNSSNPPTTGETTIASNITQAKDYRIHNTNNDGGTIVVTDSEGNKTETNLPPNSTVDVGVPAGGSLMIQDPPDQGTSSPGGTYE